MIEYTEGIVEEILHYLKDNTYPYAVLLDGPWGIGKTHFVKTDLRQRLSEDEWAKNTMTVKYVSIYGCSSKDDIRTTILETIFADYVDGVIDKHQSKDIHGAKKINQAKHIKLGLSFVERNLTFFLAKKGINIEKRNILDGVIDLSDYFFIIDDIERCTCSMDELLGVLNDLVEHESVKMLLVANELEISNTIPVGNCNEALEYLVASDTRIIVGESQIKTSSQSGSSSETSFDINRLKQRASDIFSDSQRRSYYDTIKEKLIGHTIMFQPDLASVMHLIIKDTVGNTSVLSN